MMFAVAVVSPPGYIYSEAFRDVAEALHCAFSRLAMTR